MENEFSLNKRLLEQVVFELGHSTDAMVSPDVRDIRATFDVDMIADVNLNQFYKLDEQMRSKGFIPDSAIVCRYRKQELVLDVMPVDPKILGFSNKWYKYAIKDAMIVKIGSVEIKVITFPIF